MSFLPNKALSQYSKGCTCTERDCERELVWIIAQYDSIGSSSSARTESPMQTTIAALAEV